MVNSAFSARKRKIIATFFIKFAVQDQVRSKNHIQSKNSKTKPLCGRIEAIECEYANEQPGVLPWRQRDNESFEFDSGSSQDPIKLYYFGGPVEGQHKSHNFILPFDSLIIVLV